MADEETPKQNLSKYLFSLTQTLDSNVYKTTIEVTPALAIGVAKSEEGQEAKGIVASKLELIAKSPNFSRPGYMNIKVLSRSDEGVYSFGKTYNNPEKLKKYYLKLIEKITKRHKKCESLKLLLFPL